MGFQSHHFLIKDFLISIGVLMIVKGGHVSNAYEDATCEDVALESVSKIIDLCKSIEKGKLVLKIRPL